MPTKRSKHKPSTSPSKLPHGYKPGPFRPFHTSKLLNYFQLTKLDQFLTVSLLALSVIIRLYKLYHPARVIFDEVHLGTFSREYFKGEFFMDVHPPLGKLIFFWVAMYFGWNGEFGFEEIGDAYDNNVPFLAMRMVLALSGIGTIMLTYFMMRLCCRSGSLVPWFVSVLVLIENSLVTQSRLIMLDLPLMFAQSVTMFGYKSFANQRPFSGNWFLMLLLTGLGLGVSVCIKLTGLYTIAWVGILTIIQLWNILGDLEVPISTWVKHVIYRAIALILIPISMYLYFFQIHFDMLPYNGSGSGTVQSAFRSTFEDSELQFMPVEVLYGNSVTIKHNNLELYLHSHNATYESGSGEQQVTLYHSDFDEYNEWMIESKNKFNERLIEKQKPVEDGDIIRLYHKVTGKYLHVNDVRPPLSDYDYANEVSCAGDRDLLGDINYEFKVKIIDKKPHGRKDLPLIKLRATESIFQLIHQGTKCTLLGHEDLLPEWGFGQNEVVCIDEPTIPNTLWYIELNFNPKKNVTFEKITFGPYSYWQKLKEVHRAMFRINRSFTQDHDYASTPGGWPFVLRGVGYFGSHNDVMEKLTDEPGSMIYLLGNVVIYYLAFFILTLCIAKYLIHLFFQMNPFKIPNESPIVTNFYENSRDWILGWALHYLPSFLMSRKLFLHHYFPALYFSIVLIGQYVDYQMSRRKYFAYGLISVILVGSLYCFITMIPIIYGTGWTVAGCTASKLFSTWDYDCMAYSDSVDFVHDDVVYEDEVYE